MLIIFLLLVKNSKLNVPIYPNKVLFLHFMYKLPLFFELTGNYCD